MLASDARAHKTDPLPRSCLAMRIAGLADVGEFIQFHDFVWGWNAIWA